MYEPRHGKSAIKAYAYSIGSDEPAYLHSLARTYAIRSHLRWVKGKLLPKNLTCGLAKGPAMRTERLIRLNSFLSLCGSYEGPAKRFVTGFGLLQCYVLSNIFLLQTFKVFSLY